MSLLQDYDPSGGLQFNRLFTEEGVHPYNSVTWEKRDVEVTSASGESIFSQKGVEFPSSWSLNSSQIVTSKYFHGRLGKPEREHSLKQLIDRVVDTIGTWGIEGKYFKSDEDKNVFTDELRDILLHQRAAFNSPVWFNMGTMVKPQSSACQPYHSLINTTQGLISIGEIVDQNLIGLPVYDSKGITQVINVMHNGQKDVFKVVLNDGHFIEVTGDHLVCVHSERRIKRLEWRRVGQLEIGEYMRVYTKIAKTITPPCDDAKFISEAALAGWLQADGFVGQYENGTNKSLTIEFMVINEDEEHWVKTHLEKVFPDVHFNERGVESKTHEGLIIANRIRLYGEALHDFVEKYELLNRGLNIRIPKIINTAPNDVVRAYLRSVFESDGYVSNNGTSTHVALATISKEWMEDVLVLLSRFGVYSRLRQKRENRPDRYNMWEVDISIRSERKRFAAEINFISTRKQDKLARSIRIPGKVCPPIRYQKIVEIIPIGKSDVYDIQTKSSNYLTNSVLVHNCFINSVEDTMDSILDLAKTEGMIFKYGSGSGVNLSKLRAKGESLSTGGTSSGPLSFMKGYDSFAGSIKSGGKCYKKGTLVSTPDGLIPIQDLAIGDLVLTHEGTRAINDFMINGKKQCFLVQTIEGYTVEVTEGHKFAYWHAELGNFLTKPIEKFKEGEQLYLLLQPSLGGKEILLTHPERTLQKHETTTKEMKLPKILNDKFAYILGLMYGDGNITEELWRIRISFSIDETGVRSIDQFLSYCRDLFEDEPFKQEGRGNYVVYNYTRKRLLQLLQINGLAKGKGDNLHFPKQLFTAKPNIRSSFIAGYFDADGNYQRRGGFSFTSIDPVYLKNIQKLLLTLGIPSKLKVSRPETGNWKTLYRLYVVGSTFTQLFANHIGQYSVKVQDQFIPSNKTNKGWGYRDIEYGDIHQWGVKGTKQFIERKLGQSNTTVGYGGVVAISEKFPEEVVGLISSRLSQCVPVTLKTVSLSEMAETYDIEVAGEHLLSANGIYASNTRRAAKMILLDVEHPDVIDFIESKAKEERKAWALIDAGYDGSFTGEAYNSVFFQNANHSVRVTDDFMDRVLKDENWNLREVTSNEITKSIQAREILNKVSEATHLCGDPGLQYSTTINKWHTCKVSGPINASNPCSEYLFLDDTACNLASINLMKYREEDGSFNVEAFVHTVNIIISAQEIIVGRSSYPTQIIEENSHIYRTLGIGYTNLGALLMSLGLPYDSDEARNVTAAISSLMTGQSYLQSSKIAANLGAFKGYTHNKESMMNVMNMHKNAAKTLNAKAVDMNLFENAQNVWDDVVEHGIEYGYRNAQASVIAPTGTISFMMAADTTGIEPDISLIKYKKLVGGGYMKIVNSTVPLALKNLKYTTKEIDEITNYINEKGVAEGAPHLKEEHLPVFDCSIKSQNSTRTIHHMAHVTMMAAAQPFISGAISKTVNMPEDSTIDDINEVYIQAWQMGIKAVAIYRDNSKRLQPLNTEDESGDKATIGKKYDEVIQPHGPVRRRLPGTRDSKIHKFEVNGHEGYIIVGLYDDDTPGEVFIKMSKQGSTLGGVMDTVAVLTSMSLQYGVPLSALIRKFIHSKFEPSGMTKNPKIPIASSIIDYIFRWLALEFLPKDERPGVIDYTELAEEQSEPGQVYQTVSAAVSGTGPTEFVDDNQICFQCGAIAIRSGSCYACPECGSTSGCS